MADTKEYISEKELTNDDSQESNESKWDRIESDSVLDPKCPGGCKTRLTKDVRERSRSCGLCGDLFCYKCTIYRRKLSKVFKFSPDHEKPKKKHLQLSIKLVPDDVFGTLHNVCSKCHKSEAEIPIYGFRDLMDDFQCFRLGKLGTEDAKEREGSLCCRKYAYSTSKRQAIVKEVERLTQGFVKNSSFVKELASEMKVPKWHKSAKWVDASSVHHCYHCEKTFKMSSTKVNCRIGGQVVCKKCSQDDMIIYLEETDGEPKWGINGKVGPQSKDQVARFELYKICTICSDTLHSIYCENEGFESESEQLKAKSFMDSVSQLQQSMATLQGKVDKWLPDYIQALEALDGGSVDKMTRDDRIKLAKLYYDITHTQSVVKEMCYGFHKLQPQTQSQKSILKNAKMGIENIYNEHKHQMECPCELLSREMIEELHEVQKLASRKSMERVSADVYQMAADVVEHRDRYDLDDSLPDEAEKILFSINEEFLKGYLWNENYESMMMIRRKSFQIESRVGNQTALTLKDVQCMIASHCYTVVQECCSQLEANTLETEYRDTKNSFKIASEKFGKSMV